MEPDILATTRDPLADAIGRGPSSDGLTSGIPADDHSPQPNGVHADVAALHGVALSASHGLAVNGHGANGQLHIEGATRTGHATTNGHAHHHANGHSLIRANGMSGHRSIHEPLAAMGGARLALGRPIAPAIAAETRRRDQTLYLQYGKRALDVVGAAIGLVLAAPIMLAIAIAIRIESRGPVFYRSTRIARNGRPFTFLKFRSMVDGADRHRHHLTHLNECDGPVFKISRDPRVTGIGRFLRITSLDEIPQFLNVLRGEMSLVGPRPPLPEEVAQYEPWQMRRLEVRPGLTCLWQISGRSRIGFREWMRLDLEYIKHQSFWLDVRILLRTIPAVMSRDGAY